MSWTERLARALRGRGRETGTAEGSPGVWQLRKDAASALAKVMTAPSEEQARTYAAEARRLLDVAQALADDEACGRDFERRVKQRPGGVYFPSDGPM